MRLIPRNQGGRARPAERQWRQLGVLNPSEGGLAVAGAPAQPKGNGDRRRGARLPGWQPGGRARPAERQWRLNPGQDVSLGVAFGGRARPAERQWRHLLGKEGHTVGVLAGAPAEVGRRGAGAESGRAAARPYLPLARAGRARAVVHASCVPPTALPPSARSAGCQPAVSPTSSRPQPVVCPAPAGWKPAIRQTRGLRYGAAPQRGPTDSAGQPAHCPRFVVEGAPVLRGSVWREPLADVFGALGGWPTGRLRRQPAADSGVSRRLTTRCAPTSLPAAG